MCLLLSGYLLIYSKPSVCVRVQCVCVHAYVCVCVCVCVCGCVCVGVFPSTYVSPSRSFSNTALHLAGRAADLWVRFDPLRDDTSPLRPLLELRRDLVAG